MRRRMVLAVLVLLTGCASSAASRAPGGATFGGPVSDAPGRDPRGRIRRSASIRAAFRRHVPCPATGERRGPCPGWEVHHHVPLHCGGSDAVDNLRWIPVEDHDAYHSRRSCD